MQKARASVTVIVTLCEPTSLFVGTPVRTPEVAVNVSHAGTVVPESVRVSPTSTSAPVTV